MSSADSTITDLAESLAKRVACRFERDINPTALITFGETLCNNLGQIVDRYCDNGLAYHNPEHLRNCLITFDQVRCLAEDPEAVEIALWYHDVIYDPQARDNEEASAEMAQQQLLDIGLPKPWVAKAADLVLATRHIIPVDAADAHLIRDVDLAVLGQHVNTYRRYAEAVREEFHHVDHAAYAAGRTKILNTFLQQQRIYATDWFFDRYEAAARENLKTELRRLNAT